MMTKHTSMFKYYIVNLFEGTAQGSDILTEANEFAADPDYCVIDAESGLIVDPNGFDIPIEEA